MKRPVFAVLLALLVGPAFWGSGAQAQEPELASAERPTPGRTPSLEWLEFGLVSGDPAFLFWIGTTAMAGAEGVATRRERKAWLTVASKAFRRILVIAPSEVRPRLELARTFFLLGEDALAREHFEKALAGALPAQVKRNIQMHLDLMQRRKRWAASLGMALAPDTNIGAADTGDTVEVGPFRLRLDDPNESESGIGLHTWGNWQYSRPLHPRLNWRASANVSVRDYPHRDFDQWHVSARTGVQGLWRAFHVSLLGEAGRSWLAGHPYSDEFGMLASASFRLSPRLVLHPHVRWVERDYHETGNRDQDGPRWRAGGQATWHLTPQLTVQGGVHYERERPQRKDYRSVRRSLDFGGSYELPQGFTVGLNASLARTEYEPHWGFLTRGEPKRRDRLHAYRLSVQHRGWTLQGFAPRFSVIRDTRMSNAQLHDYERWRGEIALVRQF